MASSLQAYPLYRSDSKCSSFGILSCSSCHLGYTASRGEYKGALYSVLVVDFSRRVTESIPDQRLSQLGNARAYF